MFVDSHAHFDMILEDENLTEQELIKNIKYHNLEYAVQISTEAEGLEWSIDFARRNRDSGIFYSLGLHPSSEADDTRLEKLSSLIEKEMKSKNANLLIGIGECGLDYYRMHQPKDVQMKSFEFQIDLSKKYRLPLIIHTRDAMDDTIETLKRRKVRGGIMHCFSGDSKAAEKVLDRGMMISFAGNVTYRNAADLHDAAKYVPLDRLLLETDSPFLSPVPLRGKPNFSENVKHTYKFIANLKNISLSKVEDAVYENFEKLIR